MGKVFDFDALQTWRIVGVNKSIKSRWKTQHMYNPPILIAFHKTLYSPKLHAPYQSRK
jgi:hypothetical protein